MQTLDMLEKHLRDLKDAIEECYKKAWHMPCLVLLYSGIDAVASLEPSRGKHIGDRFERWVEEYLLPSGSLSCNSIDLWAARCGVVHTFTPESELYRKGKSRQVGYVFGPESLEKLNNAAVLTGQINLVNVHVRDLIDAFYGGCLAYLKDVLLDSQRRQELESTAGLWTGYVAPETMDAFIKVTSPTGAGQ